MDNSRVEDEGGPRVRHAVEYGRAGRVLKWAAKLSGGSSLVFPSRTGGPKKAPGRVLHSAGVASTLHGFRSSARSWMAESGVPAEVAEACLAHVPRSQVVQAYQRSDLLARRAQVLQAWSDYIL